MTCSSSESDAVSTQVLPFSSSTPLWIKSVASPPSSTITSGPWPSGQVSALNVQSQYSSKFSPSQAKTEAEPSLAMAAAA